MDTDSFFYGGTMLGYCGINCAECPAYQGTVLTDIGLLKKAAGRSWNGEHSASEWVCLGCTPADQGILAKDCSACKIRTCAIAKGALICAVCGDYDSCQLMLDFINGASEPRCNEPERVRSRMEWLRTRFLAYQEERMAQTGAGR